MRFGGAAPKMDRMKSMRIVIALAGSAPLCGEVQAPGQPNRPFTGWLGLLSALQAITGAMAAPSDGPQTHGREIVR